MKQGKLLTALLPSIFWVQPALAKKVGTQMCGLQAGYLQNPIGSAGICSRTSGGS